MSVAELSISRNRNKTHEQIERDAEDIAQFYRTFLTQTGSAIFDRSTLEKYTTPLGVHNALLTTAFLFLREGNTIVGVANLRPRKNLLIEMINVLESHRRKGVGTKLYYATEGYARKHRLRHVNGQFVPENSQKLAKRVLRTKRFRYKGFRKVGVAAAYESGEQPMLGRKTPYSIFVYSKVSHPRKNTPKPVVKKKARRS